MISKYIIPRSTSRMSADILCHIITMASDFQWLSFRSRSRTIHSKNDVVKITYNVCYNDAFYIAYSFLLK